VGAVDLVVIGLLALHLLLLALSFVLVLLPLVFGLRHHGEWQAGTNQNCNNDMFPVHGLRPFIVDCSAGLPAHLGTYGGKHY